MTVQDIYRVLLSTEKIVFSTKFRIDEWHGLAKDIPNKYFDYLIDTIYSVEDEEDSCIIIDLKSQNFFS